MTDLNFENLTYGRIKLQRSRLRLWEQFYSPDQYTVSADPEKISVVNISFSLILETHWLYCTGTQMG